MSTKKLLDRIKQLTEERLLMARLASEEPQFNNPLIVWEAQKIRDKIISGEI